MNKKFKAPKKTFAEINQAWQASRKLEIRSRLKAVKQIGFDVIASYDKRVITPEQLELYIIILREAVRTQSNTAKYARALAKLFVDKLELSGNHNAEIIAKKSSKIAVDGGMIVVGDFSLVVPAPVDYSDKEYLVLINSGQRYLFQTGGDGFYDIQLRIIKANDPVLTIKEYKFVENATEPVIISIPAGQVAVADVGAINDTEHECLQKVESGNYKISVFVFNIPGKLRSYYIVMCKTDEEINNNLAKVDMLE